MKGDPLELLRAFYETAVTSHPNKQSLLQSFGALVGSFAAPLVLGSQKTLDIPLGVTRNVSIKSASRTKLATEEVEKARSSNQDKSSLKPPERNENLPTKDSGSGNTGSRSFRSSVSARGIQPNIKDLILSLQTFYGCQWIYLHQQINRVLIYFCFTCFLGTGNGIALSRFQAKLKKRTPELKVTSTEMEAITKGWAIIDETIDSRKKGKWQKIFKGIVDSFPEDFVKLMVSVIAGKQSSSEVPDGELLNIFAKELKISLLLLQIEYKNIQRQQTFGNYPIELPLAVFWRGKMFGVANKPPAYSLEEKNCDQFRASWITEARQIRSKSDRHTQELIEADLEIDSQAKEQEIRKFIAKFLA